MANGAFVRSPNSYGYISAGWSPAGTLGGGRALRLARPVVLLLKIAAAL